MILVAYNHALRASEVLAIKRDDIADGFLDVQRLKGSLHTIQPLISDVHSLLSERESLIEYAANIPFGQPLFKLSRQRFWQIVRQHGQTAGIPKHLLFPHVLKHSLAMHTIQVAGIENVRQYLGHRSLSSTGEYLKISDSDAAAAMQRARGAKL